MIDNNEIPSSGLCSDAAYSTSTKIAEWQVVNIETKEIIYHNKLYSETLYLTNLAEYWGLVKSIKLAIELGIDKVYCDSATAIAWVSNSKVNTSVTNEKLLKLVVAGEQYIIFAKEYLDFPQVLKWRTKTNSEGNGWGEILADFNRK